MSPEHAGVLLDDVILARVREHIDTCGLYDLQAELAQSIRGRGLAGSDLEARRIACAMIERALRRFAERVTFLFEHMLDEEQAADSAEALTRPA